MVVLATAANASTSLWRRPGGPQQPRRQPLTPARKDRSRPLVLGRVALVETLHRSGNPAQEEGSRLAQFGGKTTK